MSGACIKLGMNDQISRMYFDPFYQTNHLFFMGECRRNEYQIAANNDKKNEQNSPKVHLNTPCQCSRPKAMVYFRN
jgi:hypothetical protein